MFLLASHLSTAMFALGVVLMIVILLRRHLRYRKRLRKEQVPSTQVRDQTAALDKLGPNSKQPLMSAPPEILRWQVEMHETARELKAELDSKISALQALVIQSRGEIERLEAALRRAEQLGLSGCRDTLAEIERLASADASDQGQLPPLQEASPVPVDKYTQREVFRLADQGCSLTFIADKIGIPLGDVELTLGLRN